MKLSTAVLSLLLPVTALAQNYPGMGGGGMSQGDMQNMMQRAHEMQTCMQGIDQSKIVPLLVKTIQELEARIAALETA